MSKKVQDRNSDFLNVTNEENKSGNENFQQDLYTNMSIVKNIYQKTKDNRNIDSNIYFDQSLINIENNNFNNEERKMKFFLLVLPE